MNQDRSDKNFREILGSMEEQDTLEAMNRKEGIWQKVFNDKKRKKKSYWWLLLLLGGLLLLAGWFFNSLRNTTTKSSPTQSFANVADQIKNYELQLTQAQLTLNSNQRLLDSMHLVNENLVSKISSLAQVKESSLTPTENIKYDTVYLTEIKVEEKIVEKFIEKIIRDTVVLERILTEDISEPIADANNEKTPKESEAFLESSKRPSSVQFNFSEANREDN